VRLDQNLITNHTVDWLMNTDGVNPCMICKGAVLQPNNFLLCCYNSAGFIRNRNVTGVNNTALLYIHKKNAF